MAIICSNCSCHVSICGCVPAVTSAKAGAAQLPTRPTPHNAKVADPTEFRSSWLAMMAAGDDKESL